VRTYAARARARSRAMRMWDTRTHTGPFTRVWVHAMLRTQVEIISAFTFHRSGRERATTSDSAASARTSERASSRIRVASRGCGGCNSRLEAALHASNSALRALRHSAKYACDRRSRARRTRRFRISLVAQPRARRYVTFHNS